MRCLLSCSVFFPSGMTTAILMEAFSLGIISNRVSFYKQLLFLSYRTLSKTERVMILHCLDVHMYTQVLLDLHVTRNVLQPI